MSIEAAINSTVNFQIRLLGVPFFWEAGLNLQETLQIAMLIWM
jgi:hypothetical protein